MKSSQSLIEAIKLLIKKEVKAALKEAVNAEVNAILAEKFVASIGNRNLIESVAAPTVQSKPIQTVDEKKEAEKRRKQLLNKLGVENNPMGSFIFEDIEVPQAGGVNSEGVYVDDDGEGIDLSLFGR